MRKHHKDRIRGIKDAVLMTAKSGVKTVRSYMPVAFRSLYNSTVAYKTADGATIEIAAPHAAAVERGSRPHWVPLAPLIEWVKLRGMQGLRGGKLLGVTSRSAARLVRGQLGKMAKDHGGFNAVDDPVRVAKGIQRAISIVGTPPSNYARNSLPALRDLLDMYVHTALSNSSGLGSE
jgi:hypothetical protein